jgi:3-hydroxyisobutyrate dehydrogenase
MSTIGFIGLGHMGTPMARNLLKSSHTIIGYDISEQAVNELVESGGVRGKSVAEVAKNTEVVITMLPKGSHVQSVYLGNGGLIANCDRPHLFIDCSTIDIETSKLVADRAIKEGHQFMDAPVSGGEIGAINGTLSFMVGCDEAVFEQAKPVLSLMGRNLFYVGKNGAGLAVKIVNNMLLGIEMAATGEAFNMIAKLGIDAKRFYQIVSKSTGVSWALKENCPIPGVIEGSPADNNYIPGFACALMSKDLALGQQLAMNTNVAAPLGAMAAAIFNMACHAGFARQDMSAVMKFLGGQKG